jgi:hypothetical protein
MLDVAQCKQITAVRIGYEMALNEELTDLTHDGHLTAKQYEAVKQLAFFALREFEKRLKINICLKE